MNKKKLEELSKNLLSNDNLIVLNTLKEIREEGHDSILYSLVDVFAQNKNTEIQSAISNVFNDLKNQSSAIIIIDLLKKELTHDTRKMLLSSCWQSRLNYLDELELFIDVVISEDFDLSFEAFTVIENIEVKTTPKRKSVLKTYIKEKLRNCKKDNQALAQDMVEIVNNYEELV